MRELNQHMTQVLDQVRTDGPVLVTKNGQPWVRIYPPDSGPEGGDYPFRTDAPLGYDDVPVFHAGPDFSQQSDELMKGFGSD